MPRIKTDFQSANSGEPQQENPLLGVDLAVNAGSKRYM